MTGRLQGKVAVVTGGASGLGAATAKRFRAEGADVLITDVQQEKGEAVARECDAVFLKHDVSSEAEWKKVGEAIDSKFGRLDILVNNAGMMSNRSIESMDLNAWRRVLSVNLDSVMLGSQMAIERMRKDKNGSGGSIINIGSTTAFAGLADDAAYTTSKGAIRSLTKSMAVWCARNNTGIRCNTLHPGTTRTGIMDTALAAAENPDAMLAHLASMSPLNRIGRPEEIAALAVFLASDEASFVTGGDYLCDGATLAGHPGM